jgi:hypothetical protein
VDGVLEMVECSAVGLKDRGGGRKAVTKEWSLGRWNPGFLIRLYHTNYETPRSLIVRRTERTEGTIVGLFLHGGRVGSSTRVACLRCMPWKVQKGTDKAEEGVPYGCGQGKRVCAQRVCIQTRRSSVANHTPRGACLTA